MSGKSLKENLDFSFDNDDLRVVCFDLGIDFDGLKGETKLGRIVSLIERIRQTGRILEFRDYLIEARPKIDWQKSFEEFWGKEAFLSPTSLPPNSSRLFIIIDRDLKDFTKRDLDGIVFDLSRVANTLPGQIQINGIAPGRSKFIIELPDENAKILLRASKQGNKLLANSGIKEIANLSIAIWGPTGSGKTYLIDAFVKELQWYNQRDPEFEYMLTTMNGSTVAPTRRHRGPSQDIMESHFQFTRRAKERSEAHLVSSQRHEIIIYDSPGGALMDALNPGGNRPAAVTLTNSTGVIAILEAGFQNFSGGGYGILTDEAAYNHYLRSLCELLVNNPLPGFPKRHLAVCVTKSDRLGSSIFDLKGKEVVETFFGARIPATLASYERDLHIGYFCTSAVGYYRDRGEILSNLEPATGTILYPELWHPLNIAAPFFWLFEEVEKARLATRGRRPYILYPRLNYPVTR